MDHAEPFPEGTTSAGNCHAWCTTCHQLKTERRLRFTDTKPDGSATLTTAWGQRFSIPPRPFLHDPNDDPGDDGNDTGLPRQSPGDDGPGSRPSCSEGESAGVPPDDPPPF